MEKKIVINGKAIYTPKGAALEYGRVGCNFYTGCPHDCEYCYLKRGAPSKQLGGTEVRLKKCFKNEEDAFEVFKKEVSLHIDYLRQVGIFFSFTTDPLLDKTRMLTLTSAKYAVRLGVPIKILTKCATASLLYILNKTFAPEECEQISIGFTLTGRDDMEPNASSNLDRIDAMRWIKQLGFKTFASIEPVIDWQHSLMAIGASLICCDHYKIGLRSGVKKDYYDLLSGGSNIRTMIELIVKSGRTVYLKESARKLLQRCYQPGAYEEFMSYTVDMDGNPYKKTNSL